MIEEIPDASSSGFAIPYTTQWSIILWALSNKEFVEISVSDIWQGVLYGYPKLLQLMLLLLLAYLVCIVTRKVRNIMPCIMKHYKDSYPL